MADQGRGGLVGNLPMGVKLAAVGLLIHYLMKNRDQGAAPAGAQGGGGLGDILGGLFGGGRQGPPAAGSTGGGGLGGLLGGGGGGLGGLLGGGGGLGGLLGGLAGMLGGLRRQGLAEEVDSWVSTGPNRPVSPDRLASAFDPDEIDAAARQAGTDRGTLMDAVSQMLPEVVDRMTPQGELPRQGAGAGGDAGAIDDLLGSMGLRGGDPRR